jgi:hypothetical protein
MRISQLGLPPARLVRRMHRRTTHLDSRTPLTMHLASPISLLLMRLVNLLPIPGLATRLVVLSVNLRLSRIQIVRSPSYPQLNTWN